jgi:hypothetical protein
MELQFHPDPAAAAARKLSANLNDLQTADNKRSKHVAAINNK